MSGSSGRFRMRRLTQAFVAKMMRLFLWFQEGRRRKTRRRVVNRERGVDALEAVAASSGKASVLSRTVRVKQRSFFSFLFCRL